MEKRYEIFVSSPHQGLTEERAIIRESIIHHGNIPVTTDDFRGGKRPPWDHIKTAIENCDYYVLIVGGLYGTKNPDEGQLSYTECEYNFAKKLEKQILIFMVSNEGLKTLPAENLEQSNSKRIQLNRFRRRLMADNRIIPWESTDHFKLQVLNEVPRWIRSNPVETGGWVRTKELMEVHRKLDRERQHKYIFTYLFDRLHPYENVSRQFLRDLGDLGDQLDSMSDVIHFLQRAIDIYVKRIIEAHIRVYFAYSLNPSHLKEGVAPEALDTLKYRLGVSNSRDGRWQEGNVLEGLSNIHNVYQNCQIIPVPDATRKLSEPGVLNIPVKDEGSVIAAPVKATSLNISIGVVGLNSPNKGEAIEHSNLIRELSILFSSLFYAYGKQLRPEKGKKVTDKFIIYKLRSEIVEYFNAVLGSHYQLMN